jgi:RimJ/RimL family protein N-acetyltransferase
VAIGMNEQPLMIHINKKLRLRKPSEDDYSKALIWYSEQEIMYNSEGLIDRVYDMTDIHKMYRYLSETGELYFIEIHEEEWLSIGDVTLSDFNVPIVIGDKKYWNRGIGKLILKVIIERAKIIGLKYLMVPKIMLLNLRSINLFEAVGFVRLAQDDKVVSYGLNLDE